MERDVRLASNESPEERREREAGQERNRVRRETREQLAELTFQVGSMRDVKVREFERLKAENNDSIRRSIAVSFDQDPNAPWDDLFSYWMEHERSREARRMNLSTDADWADIDFKYRNLHRTVRAAEGRTLGVSFTDIPPESVAGM